MVLLDKVVKFDILLGHPYQQDFSFNLSKALDKKNTQRIWNYARITTKHVERRSRYDQIRRATHCPETKVDPYRSVHDKLKFIQLLLKDVPMCFLNKGVRFVLSTLSHG